MLYKGLRIFVAASRKRDLILNARHPVSLWRGVRYLPPVALTVAIILIFFPSRGAGFAKQLLLGGEVGYSGTFLSKDVFPYVFDGLALGAHLTYGITSVVGVCIEGSFDLHKDHVTAEKQVVVNEDNEQELKWVEGPKVTNYFLSTTALSVVYAIDVLRVVPFLTAGIVGARIDRRVDGEHEKDFEAGLRFSLGFDYALLKHLALGAMVLTDRFYFGTSPHERRMAFMVRISAGLSFDKSKKFGLRR